MILAAGGTGGHINPALSAAQELRRRVPDAEILAFDGTGVHPCEWDDTESVRVTKLFLENPARMIRMLLSDES